MSDLFRAFPLGGTRETSLGSRPVPLHIYDGEVLLLGGSLDARRAADLLDGQGITPVVDRRGRAPACLWVCDFFRAGLEPHRQLQLSVAVTREPVEPVGDGAFELLRLILAEPGLRLFSAALWTDTAEAVAYHRELFGLDAFPATVNISRGEGDGFFSFRFEDDQGRLIAQGDVAPPREQPFWDGVILERALGAKFVRLLADAPWISTQVMAPGGVHYVRPCEAQVYLRAGRAVLAQYRQADARLGFGPAFPEKLDFVPTFLEHFLGFQFVYLLPYNSGDVLDGPSAA